MACIAVNNGEILLLKSLVISLKVWRDQKRISGFDTYLLKLIKFETVSCVHFHTESIPSRQHLGEFSHFCIQAYFTSKYSILQQFEIIL